FLDQGEMRNPAFRLSHVLGDLAAKADDLDRLVLARRAGTAVRDRPAIVEQISVEIGVADAVARRFHLSEVDAQITRPGTDGWRSEHMHMAGFTLRDLRFDARLRSRSGSGRRSCFDVLRKRGDRE